MVEKHKYYLLLGGNLENTLEYFEQSLHLLNKIGEVSNGSSIYKSEPWGYESTNEYKNQAIEFFSNLPPLELILQTQAIEKKLGRKKTQDNGYEDRVIDIDILFCDSLVLESDTLVIPHERLHLRLFTLEPLNEIASSFIHPKLNKTIHKLLKDLKTTKEPIDN